MAREMASDSEAPWQQIGHTVRKALEAVLQGRVRAADILGEAILFLSDPASDAGTVRLDLDSLDALELTLYLEETYGARLDLEHIDTSGIRTVDDLCQFVGFVLSLREGGDGSAPATHAGTQGGDDSVERAHQW